MDDILFTVGPAKKARSSYRSKCSNYFGRSRACAIVASPMEGANRKLPFLEWRSSMLLNRFRHRQLHIIKILNVPSLRHQPNQSIFPCFVHPLRCLCSTARSFVRAIKLLMPKRWFRRTSAPLLRDSVIWGKLAQNSNHRSTAPPHAALHAMLPRPLSNHIIKIYLLIYLFSCLRKHEMKTISCCLLGANIHRNQADGMIGIWDSRRAACE